jgi:hypothetical protein
MSIKKIIKKLNKQRKSLIDLACERENLYAIAFDSRSVHASTLENYLDTNQTLRLNITALDRAIFNLELSKTEF